MRLFLKELITFVLLAAVSYVALICLFENYSPYVAFTKNLNYRIGSYGHMFTRLNDAKATNNIDILFLGASQTYRGYDPRIFEKAGYSTFNFGSSAQTPIQTKYLLDRYLDNLNPNYVIYSVYPGTFASDGVESTMDLLANERVDMELIELAIGQNNMKVYNTLLYALIREYLFKEKKIFKEDEVKGNDIYVSGGFVEKEMSYFKHEKYDSLFWTFREQQFMELEKILEVLQEKNIKLFILQAPSTSNKINSYSNNIEFDNRMKKLGAYYNFNEYIELNDSLHFYDAHHLNTDGVKLFNAAVLELLEE